MGDKLRLKAADCEDLAIIAAFLQDARIPLREMVFAPGERRFMAAFTRYRREKQADPSSCDGLTECAVGAGLRGHRGGQAQGPPARRPRPRADAAHHRDRAGSRPADPRLPDLRGRRPDPAPHRPDRLPPRRFRRGGPVQHHALRPLRDHDAGLAGALCRAGLTPRAPGFEAAFRGLVEARREERADVREAVAAILADVAAEGDAALLRYTERFDRLTLTPDRLRVSPEEIAAAKARCPAAQLEALCARRRADPRLPRPAGAGGRPLRGRGRRAASACAGGRSTRSGSTSRAAPRPIPARC